MITRYKNFTLIDTKGDLYVKDGIIVNPTESVDQVIDGKGLTLVPAFCDLHVHFRDPGFPEKETIETGIQAALKGGFTSVNCMGNTKPICDNQETLDYILNKQNLIDLDQVVAITKNFDGKTIDHIKDMTNIKFLSDDGYGVQDDLIMYQAMLQAKERNIGFMLHEEQNQFSPFSYRMAEDLMTIRDVYLAGVTGAHVHFCHVSTKDSLDAIRQGKKKGYHITCEVSPHHIALKDSDYKVHPPIRTQEDVDAVIKAIVDGTVDVIATDHAPHTKENKAAGSPGLIGLESSFSICYETLVKTKIISLKQLINLMSTKPHQILGYSNKGKLEPGYQADFAIIDLDNNYLFDESEIASKSHNTPFLNQRFTAKVIATIRKGKEVYHDYR